MKPTKTFLAILFLALSCSVSYSQPVLEWADEYNTGIIGFGEEGDMTKDKYGNVFITGRSDSISGNSDIFTVKYKNDGTKEWIRRYDHTGLYDFGRLIRLDRFGNVYVIGIVSVSASNQDVIVLKYKPDGDLQWARRLIPAGISSDLNDETTGAVLDVITADRYMFIGVAVLQPYPHVYHAVFKLDLISSFFTSVVDIPPASIYRQHRYSDLAIDALGQVYVVGGGVGGRGMVIKYSNSLTLNWLRTYSPDALLGDVAFQFKHIKVNSAGRLVVSGTAYVHLGNSLYAYQLNSSDGSVIWRNRYFISDTTNIVLLDMILDFDDNVILGGYYAGAPPRSKGLILKHSPSGAMLWSRSMDSVYGVKYLATDPERNIYSAQGNNPMIKLNQAGNTVWYLPRSRRTTLKMYPYIGSKIYIFGTVDDWYSGYFTEVWKQSLTSGKPTMEIGEKYIFKLQNNYPNPFNPSTSIKFSVPSTGLVTLKVFDITGKEVSTLVEGNIEQGEHEVNFNATHLASGVYFYKLTSGSFTEVKKMILVK